MSKPDDVKLSQRERWKLKMEAMPARKPAPRGGSWKKGDSYINRKRKTDDAIAGTNPEKVGTMIPGISGTGTQTGYLSRAQSSYLEEIGKCRESFWYFCERHLTIIPKDFTAGPIPLQARDYQRATIDTVNMNAVTYVLKARQMGVSTIISAYFFWQTLFNPNRVHAVISHDLASANTIFNIYLGFYTRLPHYLKFPIKRSNVRELVFKHGGTIKVASQESENIAGTTLHSVHFSEFGRYKDLQMVLGSVTGALTPDAKVVYETTAQGMGPAYDMWEDDNGIAKVFFSWMKDPGYVLTQEPKKLDPRIIDYGREYNLPKERMWWASEQLLTKYSGNIKKFHQDFPLTARLAFVVSGDRRFSRHFDDKDVRLTAGRIVYKEPQDYHIYTIGVDTAGGSEKGDYSAYVVLDVTDRKRPEIVCTNYMRLLPRQFAQVAIADAQKYNAFAVVERNNHGIAVIEHFMEEHYGQMYRTMRFDKAQDRMTEQLGWNTSGTSREIILSRLDLAIEAWRINIPDKRLQKEINTFGYNEDAGKWEAVKPNHDDMLFAFGLALVGMDEHHQIQPAKGDFRPRTIEQHLKFFEANYRKPGPQDHFLDDAPVGRSVEVEAPMRPLDDMYGERWS
jgi:hypothetical protein